MDRWMFCVHNHMTYYSVHVISWNVPIKPVNDSVRATTNHLKKIVVFSGGFFVVGFFGFSFLFFWGGGGGGFFVSKTVKMNIFTFSSMLRKWVTSSQSYSFRELICAIILALTFLTCWLVPQWILQSECWFEFDWWRVQLEPECLSYIVFGISGMCFILRTKTWLELWMLTTKRIFWEI